MSSSARLISVAMVLLAALASCGREEATTRLPEEAVPNAGGLAFLNELTGTLDIELPEPTEAVAPGLANQKAESSADLISLSLNLQVFEDDDFRALSESELGRIVFIGKRVRLKGDAGTPMTHDAPNGASFTVLDMWNAVEDTERRTRDQTEWFGGIDVHHVFFEGISKTDSGAWLINWGS